MNIRSILIAVILIGIAAILYFLNTDANDPNTHQSNIDPDVLKQGLPRICAEGQNALNALEAKRQALGLKEFKHSEQVLQVAAQEFNYKSWCTKE